MPAYVLDNYLLQMKLSFKIFYLGLHVNNNIKNTKYKKNTLATYSHSLGYIHVCVCVWAFCSYLFISAAKLWGNVTIYHILWPLFNSANQNIIIIIIINPRRCNIYLNKVQKKKILRPCLSTFLGPMFNAWLPYGSCSTKLPTIRKFKYEKFMDFQILSHSHYEQAW